MIASRVLPKEQWSARLVGLGFEYVADVTQLNRTLAEVWLDPAGRHVLVPYLEGRNRERLVPESTLNRLTALNDKEG